MSRMAWSTRTTRKRRKRTMSQCTTLRAAAPCCQCSCQLPATPRLHNAPRECAIRMPEARRPTLGRADLLRQPQAPGGLRRVSVTWRRRCLPRERHLATKLQSESPHSLCYNCIITPQKTARMGEMACKREECQRHILWYATRT